MRIGIGLPNTVPGTAGETLIDWARRAEERGFAVLATIDRIAYPNYEPLAALSAAAAVTRRIELLTNILLGPTRSPVLLAKQAASIDQISGGRFTLGVGVGSRPDDYAAVDVEFSQRGRRWDRGLELMHAAWRGEAVAGSAKPVTPRPFRGNAVPVLIGGNSAAALARVVRWGVGWTAGGGGPARVAEFAPQVRQAWRDAGRSGAPRIVALAYFGLGPQADAGVDAYIKDYYGFAPWAASMAAGVPRTSEAVQNLVKQFADAGIDDLILDPTMSDTSQVDLLADAVLGR